MRTWRHFRALVKWLFVAVYLSLSKRRGEKEGELSLIILLW